MKKVERPKNSRVRHGMASCARYGCKLEICLEAQRRVGRDGRRSGGARIDGTEAMQYITRLMDRGMSTLDISNRSGLAVSQVRKIFQGERERIHWTTAEAILGIPFPEPDEFINPHGLADATGSRRRLQALSVQGFPLSFMADKGDISMYTVGVIRSGLRDRVRISGMRSIVAMHDTFWDSDPLKEGLSFGSVVRAKAWATEQGWYPTEAWDDMDDPECKPVLNTPKYIRTTEDFKELTEKFGLDRRQAAERLGMSVDAVNAALGYYKKRMTEA